MDNSKKMIERTKSSNATISNKDRIKNKRNKDEIISKVLKKRGVYVENKVVTSKLDIKDKKPIEKSNPKPPSRLRPGKKKFLGSVLTILSKSTAGTQYELEDEKSKKKNLKIIRGSSEYDEMITENAILNNNTVSNKKKKFKSKILNKRRNEHEQLIVLHSNTVIFDTPSINSESNVNFSHSITADSENLLMKPEETALNRTINERTTTCKKVTIDTVSRTLVADKSNEKLYDFFVNLLETTISAYNLHKEANKVISDNSSSITLKIDESVAKKLEVRTNFHEINQKSSEIYSINDHIEQQWDDDEVLDHFQTEPLQIPDLPIKYNKRRLRLKKENKTITNSNSFYHAKKKSNRKHTKEDFLALFKKELKIDAELCEESESFYQALKTIAQNKRKTEKSIRFDHIKKHNDINECKLKRQKIIVPMKKLNKNRYNREDEMSPEFSKSTKNYLTKNTMSDQRLDFDVSKFSLEVYGYEFDPNIYRRDYNKEEKEIMLTYHSSPSASDFENNKLVMKYSDSTETVRNIY